jgi:2-oxoglutarate dehydrogenase E1 component
LREPPVLMTVLKPYRKGTPVVWVQEEPENMGAWRYLRARFGFLLEERLPFHGIYRAISASPATGSASCHKKEQRQIIDKAFSDTLPI